MRRTATFLLLLAAVALGATACGGSSASSTSGSSTPTKSSEESGGMTTISGDAANVHGVKDVSGMDEISLELDDFYFGPTVLKGTPGQQLKIELENESSTEHNFSLDQQSLDRDVEAGDTATVTVTFPSSGTLQFYCKYHKQLGMVGGLQSG